MIEPSFFKHLDRLKLIIEKKVTSNYVGERESAHTGRGNLFKDHRIYAPGDDYRDIDWKVFARTDKLHVKRYEEDRNLTLHIILDSSKSMDYGADVNKFGFASLIGLGFAYLALKNNERFVLSTFADSLQQFKPERGRKKLLETIDYLKRVTPGGTTKFSESLLSYGNRIGSRSVVVVISDFLYEPEEIKRALSGLRNNKIVLIQVLDPSEENLTLRGEFNLHDLESSMKIKTFIDHMLKRNYQTALQEHKQRLQWTANSIGARFYSFTTDRLVYDVLYDVLRR